MKRISFLLTAILALFLGSCIYEAPFVEKADIGIDRDLLGAWESTDSADKKPERMVVLPFSGTEYLSHHPADDGGIYYRGYLIEMGGRRYVQLQALGTRKGVPKDLDAPYTLAWCVRQGDRLTLRMINKDVVAPALKDSTALREAFLKHKDDANLFDEPGVFLRVEDKE